MLMTHCGRDDLFCLFETSESFSSFGQLRFVNPPGGKTTDWRAVCGRSACTVRREGELRLSLPLSLFATEIAKCPIPSVRRIALIVFTERHWESRTALMP